MADGGRCLRWRGDGWMIDRRLRRLPELAAPERHSSGHQERHAGGGNRVRSADEGRLSRRRRLRAVPAQRRNQLDQATSCGRCATSIRDSRMDVCRHGQHRPAAVHSGGLAHSRGLASPATRTCSPVATLPADGGPEAQPARPGQGRWQADLRQADRPLSLGHEARGRSARAPASSTIRISATNAA